MEFESNGNRNGGVRAGFAVGDNNTTKREKSSKSGVEKSAPKFLLILDF